MHSFCREKITVVIGTPIETPRIEDPTREEVQKFLDMFIAQLQDIYERHKAAAGYPTSTLTVM